MEVKYYESHVTIEPVFEERLELFREICRKWSFRAADLLMQKRKVETPMRSDKDTFCTGRGKDFDELKELMLQLVSELREQGFAVWRQKIEAVLLDERLKTA